MQKLLWMLVFVYTQSSAAPAREVTYTFTQSDGEAFQAQQKGDEHLHWLETADGSIVVLNKKSGNYEFAVVEGTDLVPSREAYSAKKRQSRNAKSMDIHHLWHLKRQEHAHQRALNLK